MRESELVGVWSGRAIYGSSPGGDYLIFKPVGTGRYEFINWRLCSAHLFRWKIPQPGVLRIFWERDLEPSLDGRTIEEQPSLWGTCDLPYRIAQEDTPASGRIRVLRLALRETLGTVMEDAFGFAQADLSDYEEPKFKLKG